jgi:hypothetical protein
LRVQWHVQPPSLSACRVSKYTHYHLGIFATALSISAFWFDETGRR